MASLSAASIMSSFAGRGYFSEELFRKRGTFPSNRFRRSRTMSFSHLFTSAKLGNLEIPNRYVQTSVQTRGGTEDGFVGQPLFDFHRARLGQAGLVTVQQTFAWPSVKLARGLALWDDKYIEKLAELAALIKSGGAKVFLQLGGAGSRAGTKKECIAPSPVRGSWDLVVPREMTRQEILDYIECYAQAGKRLYEAGFDGFALHGGSGKFISQFLSPYSNRRTDDFGGSARKRITLPRMIVEAVRERTRSDFPVYIRFPKCDYMEGGMTLEEGIEEMGYLAEAGVDAFLMAAGGQERLWHGVPIYAEGEERNVEDTAKVKKALPDVAIIASCGMHDPHLADKMIAEGVADFIGIARPLLADPDYVGKLRRGEENSIRRCVRCNNCQTWASRPRLANRGMCCTVNPSLMMEGTYVPTPAPTPKKIYVVGGGLAGMRCALTLAERGHQVELFEKTGELGGQWLVASAGKDKATFRTLVPWLHENMLKAGVAIHLNTELDRERILSDRPDDIVLATGATPRPLTGVDGLDSGMNIVYAMDVLRGKVATGERCVVLGGRYIGLETALELARDGKKVCLVELNELGRGLISRIRGWLFKEIAACDNIRLFPNSSLFRLTEHTVEIAHGSALFPVKADTLVLAIGTVPDKKLEQALEGCDIPVHAIGDCDHIGDAYEAMDQGLALGLKL